MKKRYLFPLIAVGGLTGIGILGGLHGINNINQCNSGDTAACDEIVELHGSDYDFAKEVTNKYYQDKIAALQKKEADAKAKAEAEKAAARERADAALKKQEEERKKAAEKLRAEEAAFKAEGWMELKPGIYGRWCTQTCNSSAVIGDNRYSLLEVWAKDRAAGDIYARVNLLKDGVVIGWTNDTSYLSLGQKGVLTFDSYQWFDSAQITEFNTSG